MVAQSSADAAKAASATDTGLPRDGRLLSVSGAPFGAILMAPPWAFQTFSGENMTPHRCAEDHYRTMDLAALKRLPVGDVAAKDCALFMWVVGSHLAESIELASAW